MHGLIEEYGELMMMIVIIGGIIFGLNCILTALTTGNLNFLFSM